MELKELENRIVEMDWGSIYNLNPSDLSKLTDNFSEPLVRLLFSKSRVIGAQRELFKFIKKSYSLYQNRVNLLWRENSPMFGMYPDYFDSIEANLECNRIITKNGSTSIEFKQYVSDISAVFRQNIPDNNSQKEIFEHENEERKRYLKKIESLEERVKELEDENTHLNTCKISLEAKLADLEESAEWATEKEDILIELLTPIFKKDRDMAKVFAKEVDGCEDLDVINIVAQYVKQKKVIKNSFRRKLWSILHAYKIYSAKESNWNTTLNHRICQN